MHTRCQIPPNKLYPMLFQHHYPTTWPHFHTFHVQNRPHHWTHAFNVHVIWWPHLHLHHVIKQTHQFPSSVHPCRPSSTFISHSLLNLTLLVVIDCNTIDDIYNMISVLQNKVCVLQKMVFANHLWNFPSLKCRRISCIVHLTSKIWRFKV
jgi:hypothetical protein